VYQQIADRVFTPFLESFNPQLLLISVGFDAHWSDPITTLGLSTAGYFMLAQNVLALAATYCNGKIVFVLEGGYNPANVASGAAAVFAAATGVEMPAAIDFSPHQEPDYAAHIEEIRKRHGF
jgi:acetoin utilization deacetylase AcuC-like enzyme